VILLSDDEICKLVNDNPTDCDWEKIVAQAQLQKIVQWLEEPCPHGIGDFRDDDLPVTQCRRRCCDLCWNALKQEIV